MLRTLLICMLLPLFTPAFAIYKCKSNSKIAYSQQPCSDGTSVDLRDMTNNSPADADAAKARAQAAREKAELARLEKARHKREAVQERVDRASAAKRKKCQSLDLRKKRLTKDATTSRTKSSEKARGKVRRIEEKIELECGK